MTPELMHRLIDSSADLPAHAGTDKTSSLPDAIRAHVRPGASLY